MQVGKYKIERLALLLAGVAHLLSYLHWQSVLSKGTPIAAGLAGTLVFAGLVQALWAIWSYWGRSDKAEYWAGLVLALAPMLLALTIALLPLQVGGYLTSAMRDMPLFDLIALVLEGIAVVGYLRRLHQSGVPFGNFAMVLAPCVALQAAVLMILIGLGGGMLAPSSRVSYAVETADSAIPYIESSPASEGVDLGALHDLIPEGFPAPRLPEENIPTEEQITLGRYLFYDTRLSGNGTQSCSSCHIQVLAFSDGRTTPVGSTGESMLRNAPGLINVAWNATLNWANPGLTEIEEQVLIPLFAEVPVEMGVTGHEQEVLDRIRNDADYPSLFSAAFPEHAAPAEGNGTNDSKTDAASAELISFHTITQALASFVRTLISSDSAYDRYVSGEENALSPSAKRGMDLFFSERFECHHCHVGFNFTTSTVTASSTFSAANFQNNGLYNLDGEGAYPAGNRGVYEITNVQSDMGRFRPPTLRNVALTAPYMHDGSIATLEEVIQHYANGGRNIVTGEFQGDGSTNPYKSPLVPGFEASAQELEDLVAFLNALTDEQFITNPDYANPFLAAQASE